MDNIKSKIKKLLTIAHNAGATEAEAESAMTMATALMAKYNLQVDLTDDEIRPINGEAHGLGEKLDSWEQLMVSTSAMLYQCASLVFTGGGYQFTGRPANIEAAELTLNYLIEQVNRLYKASLPKGLKVSERAEYRRTFKWACAVRVSIRAHALVNSLRNSDEKALEYTGSKALVLVESFDQQLSEAREFMKLEFPDTRPVIHRDKKPGAGTLHGRQAGDTVELNRKIQ